MCEVLIIYAYRGTEMRWKESWEDWEGGDDPGFQT